MYRCILLVHKTIHNKTSYLKDKLPANHRPYMFSVNISNTFREIRCMSLRYLNSFYPNAIASWKTIIKHCVPSFDDQAFENKKSPEACAIFLDISKAFDKV